MAKIKDEVLNELKTIAVEANRLTTELGVITYRLSLLDNERIEAMKQQQECIERLNTLSKTDDELAAKIREEYGEGTVDMETGDFISPEQKQ